MRGPLAIVMRRVTGTDFSDIVVNLSVKQIKPNKRKSGLAGDRRDRVSFDQLVRHDDPHRGIAAA